jgi:hypothetical protein
MKIVAVLGVCGAVLVSSLAQATPILTQKGDSNRSGATLNEVALTPSTVSQAHFGKGYTLPVAGELYAQPLIAENVPVRVNGPTRPVNMVILADYENNVYAYDATAHSPSVLYWSANFGPPVPAANVQCKGFPDIDLYVGIISTPVIDAPSNTMYFVNRTYLSGDGSYHQYLHALDIATGSDRAGSPIEIAATVPGSGQDSVNGQITFNPKTQNQRAALLLQNGNVYIAWSGHNDCAPYHGWVMAYAYNASAGRFAQTGAWADSPNGIQDGIWMWGGGLVGDGTNVYFTTGNGTADAMNGGKDYGEAFVGLNAGLTTVTSWFTPKLFKRLNSFDADLGGGGVLLIPGTRLLVSGGKDGNLYVVNADNMGGFDQGADQNLQTFAVTTKEVHSGPVYWSGSPGQIVYVWPDDEHLQAYKLSGGLLNTTPVWTSAVVVPKGNDGGQMWVSANGASGGVVWAAMPDSGNANNAVVPGILRAFDAATGVELYNSYQNVARDDYGSYAKNPSPVVWNGRVYVPTFNGATSSSGNLAVYGLFY